MTATIETTSAVSFLGNGELGSNLPLWYECEWSSGMEDGTDISRGKSLQIYMLITVLLQVWQVSANL